VGVGPGNEGAYFGNMRCVPFVLETGDVQICKEDLSAEATIDHLLAEVSTFKGDAPQSDDMTCVVLRVVG